MSTVYSLHGAVFLVLSWLLRHRGQQAVQSTEALEEPLHPHGVRSYPQQDV